MNLKTRWVFFGVLFHFLTVLSTTVIGAEVSGNQSGVWTIDESPYIVTGDVVVPPGMTLRIEPGVVIKFNGYYSIKVDGTLSAIGVIGRRIVFTSIHDKEFGITRQSTTTLPGSKDWKGIEFTPGRSQSSKLDNCIIRYSDKVIAAQSVSPELMKIIIVDCNATNFIVNGRSLDIQDGSEQDYNVVESVIDTGALIPDATPPTAFKPLPASQNTKRASAANSEQNVGTDEEFTFGEITIVSAAKQEQKLRESPANVTVVTGDEIKKMGYHDFVELLYDVMGIDVNDPGQGQLDVGMRGVNDRMAMGKHFQMLLDGHDMGWKQFYRNHISTAWISLENIDRIEIVRGPSSALWGANAFLGTINIITKSPAKTEETYASFAGGSFDHTTGNIHITRKIGDQSAISVFASQYRDNIPRKIKEWSDVAKEDVILTSNERLNSNIYLRLKVGDFSFVGHQSTGDAYQTISSFSVGGNYTRFVMDKKYVIAGWERSFANNLALKLSGYYDHYSWGKGAQYENQPFNGTSVDPGISATGHFVRQMDGMDNIIGFQSQGNYKPSEKFSVTMGFDYEKWDVTRWYYPEVWKADKLEVPKFKIDIWAVYLQGDYAPNSWAKLTAGLRHDVHSVFNEVDNYRLALVLTPIRNAFMKALYGTAFKAPSLHELYYYRKNAYYGNPMIKPEKNNTVELQFGYAFKNLVQVTASLFNIDITDVIIYQKRDKAAPLISEEDFPKSQRPDGTKDYNQQVNFGHWESRGIETAVNVNITKTWMLYADYTYRNARDIDTDKSLNYAAKTQGRVGLRYFIANKAYLTLQARNTGLRLLPDVKYNETGAAWQVTADPTLEAPAYTTLDLVIFYPNLIAGFDLTLKFANLLDNDNYNAGREVLSSLPARSGFIKLGYHF